MLRKILLVILISISLNATQPTYDNLTKLYVATFNRAPDAAGLDYWLNTSSLDLEGIAQSFFDQTETKTLYPSNTLNRDFIYSVYQNLFNRVPDSSGWDYWETQLNNGPLKGGFSKNLFILAVINGAKDADITILENKKEAGLYFALYGYNNKNFAKTTMQNITDDYYTVTQVKNNLYADSGTATSNACIMDILYFDNTTATLCYEGVAKDICEQAQDSDYESNWYGFPVKGECLSLGYPQSSQTLDNSGYVFYGMAGLYAGSSTPSGYTDSYDPKTVTITEDNLVAQYTGVKIAFSSNDIEGEETLTIQQTNPKPLPTGEDIDEDYQVKAYDFTLGGRTNFIDLIEITIPYDESFIEMSADESSSVIVKYYNPNTKQYEPIDYEVDTTKNEVKILTNHLSEYAIFVLANGTRNGAFKVINNNTRKAYITATDAYYKFLSTNTATNVINEGITNNMTAGNQAYEVGFGKANEWLGLMAAGNGLASAPFSNSFLTSLTNSFNALGVGASLLQVAFDFQKGDSVALYSNLSKNTVYNTINYFGTSALQLSFIGVFAIDYSLSTFAAEALSSNEIKWKKVYDVCYNKYVSKSDKQWYIKLRDLSKTIKNPSNLGAVIETTIYNDVLDGWNESKLAGCSDDAGYSNINALGGRTDSMEYNIAMAKKEELIQRLEPVFNQLSKRISYDIRAGYKKQLEEEKNNLNQAINVQIKETIKEGKASQYAGYKFRFAPLSYNAIKSEWTGTLNANGSATGAWRILGYMQAGSPNRLELFKPEDNPDTDTPVKTIEFKTTPPSLVITFEGEQSNSNTSSATSDPSVFELYYVVDNFSVDDLVVTNKAEWSIDANTKIEVHSDSSSYDEEKTLNIEYTTESIKSTKHPTGNFDIVLTNNIVEGTRLKSTDGYSNFWCEVKKPYYIIRRIDKNPGYVSTSYFKFDANLDENRLTGDYEFTGGSDCRIFITLKIPLTCQHGNEQDNYIKSMDAYYIKFETP